MPRCQPILLTLSLALWSPAAGAADVEVQLDAGTGFVHIAPGHDRRVWELPAYRRIVLQSLSWATPEADPER